MCQMVRYKKYTGVYCSKINLSLKQNICGKVQKNWMKDVGIGISQDRQTIKLYFYAMRSPDGL